MFSPFRGNYTRSCFSLLYKRKLYIGSGLEQKKIKLKFKLLRKNFLNTITNPHPHNQHLKCNLNFFSRNKDDNIHMYPSIKISCKIQGQTDKVNYREMLSSKVFI